MKRALQIVCLGLLAWLAVEAVLLVRELRAAGGELEATLVHIRTKTLPDLNASLIQAGLVLDQVRQAAESQQASAQATIRDSARATKAAADTLERINAVVARLDAEVLPEATRTLQSTSEGVLRLSTGATEAIAETQRQLAPALEHLAVASQQAAERMADPSIAQSVANVERLTRDAADTMGHVEETAKTVEETTKRLTKPGSLFLRGLKLAGELAWKALTAIGGVGK